MDQRVEIGSKREFEALRMAVMVRHQQRWEGVDLMILVAVLGVQNAWNGVNPRIKMDVRGNIRLTSGCGQKIGEARLDRGPHQINVVVSRHQVDLKASRSQTIERFEEHRMSSENPFQRLKSGSFG